MNTTLEPVNIQVSTLTPADCWVLTEMDPLSNRRLSIRPQKLTVSLALPMRPNAKPWWRVAVEGYVIRQGDGEQTTHRRAHLYRYAADDLSSAHYTLVLEESRTLDPDLKAFAIETRREIQHTLERLAIL